MLFNGAKSRVVEARQASSADTSLDEEYIIMEGFQPTPDSMFRDSLDNLCPNMTEVYALSNGKCHAFAQSEKKICTQHYIYMQTYLPCYVYSP
jgi:hypothetical protein